MSKGMWDVELVMMTNLQEFELIVWVHVHLIHSLKLWWRVDMFSVVESGRIRNAALVSRLSMSGFSGLIFEMIL